MHLIYNKRKQNKQRTFNFIVIIAISLFSMAIGLTSCGESLEKRAVREAREYTERNCPTPIYNSTRTDSVAFDINTKTYTYYCTFFDVLDNEEFVSQNRNKMRDGMRDMVLNNTGLKNYIDAGFAFKYIIRSNSNPDKILFEDTFKK